MKFEVIHNGDLYTWKLVTNAGEIIASSPFSYHSQDEAEVSVKTFQTWVQQAAIQIVTLEPAKDWKQQAKQQLRKSWVKA